MMLGCAVSTVGTSSPRLNIWPTYTREVDGEEEGGMMLDPKVVSDQLELRDKETATLAQRVRTLERDVDIHQKRTEAWIREYHKTKAGDEKAPTAPAGDVGEKLSCGCCEWTGILDDLACPFCGTGGTVENCSRSNLAEWQQERAKELNEKRLSQQEQAPIAPKQEGDGELRIKLRAADKMAMVVDDWVRRDLISSRSPLADARLDYGKPDEYEFTKDNPTPQAKAGDEKGGG